MKFVYSPPYRIVKGDFGTYEDVDVVYLATPFTFTKIYADKYTFSGETVEDIEAIMTTERAYHDEHEEEVNVLTLRAVGVREKAVRSALIGDIIGRIREFFAIKYKDVTHIAFYPPRAWVQFDTKTEDIRDVNVLRNEIGASVRVREGTKMQPMVSGTLRLDLKNPIEKFYVKVVRDVVIVQNMTGGGV